jgi:hypothetical protein
LPSIRCKVEWGKDNWNSGKSVVIAFMKSSYRFVMDTKKLFSLPIRMPNRVDLSMDQQVTLSLSRTL